MIKALMLIFDPAATWEKIETGPKNVARVFFLFLLPLMVLSSLAESWGLLHFGLEGSTLADLPTHHTKVSPELVLRYQAVQLAFGMMIVFGGALLYRKIGESFHRRHSYADTFTTLAHSVSPLFLLRILDGLPALNTWACWGVGIALSVAALYRGIPRVMKPDPSNALGLYLLCSLLLIAVSGLAHFFANLVLQEKLLAGR
jgi:hypothetical protein